MKKLLIVAGAGASLDFGMPSVAAINSLFETWALDLAPLISSSNGSLYSYISDRLLNYIKQNKSNRIDTLINFESLLFTIQTMSEILSDRDYNTYNNRINPFVDIRIFPEVKDIAKKIKPAGGFELHLLHSHLIDKLVLKFRELCKSLPSTKPNEIKSLSDFLTALKSEFSIGVLNLNYDNVILSSLPSLETGFNKANGEFNRDILYSGNWNFCYHLHGSVHFDMKSNGTTDMHRIYWNSDLDSQFQSNSSGRSVRATAEGKSHLNSTIIAGLDKSNQILKDPFSAYFKQIDKLIYEADAILFMGYGFSDLHLNQAFSFIRDDKKTRKVVVLDWAKDTGDGLSFRHDDWSYGLFTTIPFNGHEMGRKNQEPRPAIYYKKRNQFEESVNPKYPLAVWYGGILKACEFPDRFISKLK